MVAYQKYIMSFLFVLFVSENTDNKGKKWQIIIQTVKNQ